MGTLEFFFPRTSARSHRTDRLVDRLDVCDDIHPGSQRQKQEWFLGGTKRNVLYFSQSKYSRTGLLGSSQKALPRVGKHSLRTGSSPDFGGAGPRHAGEDPIPSWPLGGRGMAPVEWSGVHVRSRVEGLAQRIVGHRISVFVPSVAMPFMTWVGCVWGDGNDMK